MARFELATFRLQGGCNNLYATLALIIVKTNCSNK